MFRVARVLRAVSPFSIFLMDQKSNPQLSGVPIARRAKLLSSMYKNLSAKQRKELHQRAKAHPSLNSKKANMRKKDSNKKKRPHPPDSNFAKFVKDNYSKVRALNYRKRFVALSQLYELQKPISIVDPALQVPLAHSVTAGTHAARRDDAAGDMTLSPTLTTTTTTPPASTTTTTAGAGSVAVDTSACKATPASGSATGATTAAATGGKKKKHSSSSSIDGASRKKHATESKRSSTSTSGSSGKTSSSSSSHGKHARKKIKHAAHATTTATAAKHSATAKVRPRAGKFLRDGFVSRVYNARGGNKSARKQL